eukprot:SAG31_NODE_4296_length_3374_cov_1.438473_1_plen_143_part_00
MHPQQLATSIYAVFELPLTLTRLWTMNAVQVEQWSSIVNETGIDKLVNVPRSAAPHSESQKEHEADNLSPLKKYASATSLERTIQTISQALGTWQYSQEIDTNVHQSQVRTTRMVCSADSKFLKRVLWSAISVFVRATGCCH